VTPELPEPLRPRRKGIYLLPNLLTTGCLFSGFYAVVAAIDKHFANAGMAVFAAMIFDTLDGRIARLTRTESAFGKEYDSLADMVAFGLAPAIVAYQWGVVRIMEYGSHWGRFGWLACFFYAGERRQALLRGPAEPLGGRHRCRLRVVLQRLA
jgi:CDP-diacylglycerol--serine O-phosphatidyltransferase